MNQPPFPPLRLDAPEPGYRLGAAERARVHPDCDPDALERLMAMIQPGLREMLLRNFLAAPPEETPAVPPGWHSIAELRDPNTGAADPVLQALLEDVYAPAWEQVPDEDLEIPGLRGVPGQERARERRQAQRRQRADHRDAER